MSKEITEAFHKNIKGIDVRIIAKNQNGHLLYINIIPPTVNTSQLKDMAAFILETAERIENDKDFHP